MARPPRRIAPTSPTRTSPEMSFGSSVSRSAARVRDCQVEPDSVDQRTTWCVKAVNSRAGRKHDPALWKVVVVTVSQDCAVACCCLRARQVNDRGRRQYGSRLRPVCCQTVVGLVHGTARPKRHIATYRTATVTTSCSWIGARMHVCTRRIGYSPLGIHDEQTMQRHDVFADTTGMSPSQYAAITSWSAATEQVSTSHECRQLATPSAPPPTPTPRTHPGTDRRSRAAAPYRGPPPWRAPGRSPRTTT